MNVAIPLLACGICGYLWGSIPTGYVIGRMVAGIDIRDHGSGSTGATNVLRTLGKWAALAVLVVDVCKGILAIGTARIVGLMVENSFATEAAWSALISWLVVAAALGAVVGHSKSVWLQWKGGKSAAISLGILFSVAWPVGLAVLAVWLGTLFLSRIVSLSSILGAIAAPICMVATHQPIAYVVFGVIGGVYVVVRHYSNIQRLLSGTEPRIGKKLEGESAIAR